MSYALLSALNKSPIADVGLKEDTMAKKKKAKKKARK
jgi:hypothetical protein